MTQRKPAGTTFESWIDQQIRVAAERGAFTGLPGAGKPLRDIDTRDEAWWLKGKLAEEGLALPLPPALQLRKDVPEALERIASLPSEGRVREALEALNQRIRMVNAHHLEGPSSNIAPVDIEGWVTHWREGQEPSATPRKHHRADR